MSYTEIPTDLLIDVASFFLNDVKPSFDNAVHPESVTLTVTSAEMEGLEPLIKWLEYIVLVWNIKEIDP
jgi:hypothetical protein